MIVLGHIAIVMLSFIYFFFKFLPTQEKITFISRQSNKITLDFSLIIEELKEELPNYKIIVLTKKLDKKISYIFHMFSQMFHIATSKIVIIDSYSLVVSLLKHKKDLQIIQIWHALGLMK